MFKVQDNLTKEQIQRGLVWIIRDGVASQAMVTFTSGAFLIAFALELGASNFEIGLLAAIGPLAQFVQLPGIFLVEKLRNRRAICVTTASISRTCWLFIALIPFLFPSHVGLMLFLGAIAVNSLFGALAGCSWNSWMRNAVPQDILGSFFSRRMRIAISVGIVLSLLAAGFLDLWKTHIPDRASAGYSILLAAGFLAGMIGIYFMAHIPEPRMPVVADRLAFFHLLWQPFKDDNFRKLMMFMASWNFAVNLAAPFFMVYMLKRLGMSMSMIIGLTVLSQVANIAFLNIWGKFTDRFSNKSVLAICGPLFILSILGWTFTTMPEKYVLTLPLLVVLHIVMGIATAGVTLGTGNLALKLSPKGQATTFLAANTMVNSLTAAIAPILGGRLADFFAARQLDWTIKYTGPVSEWSLPTLSLQQWDFFFVLAFLFGLYSLHRLAMIREVGEVEEKVVMRELATEVKLQVRTISSVMGLRHVVAFPLIIMNRLTVKKESDDVKAD